MKNTLAQDFAARKSFYANRASAVFPVHFEIMENDLILNWLNYWSIKNEIDSNTIVVNLRVYDSSGKLIVREQTPLAETNNLLSVRSFIKDEVFSGMAEIEVISSSNLKFNFPAIIGFYKSNSLYSCVHSAGRFKGSEEVQTPITTEETNWSCKFGQNITPFFHYVNGNSTENVSLKVNLYSPNGECVAAQGINEEFKAFSSKIFFIDQLFPKIKLEDTMYVGVVCQNDRVFRRMVVGNYHRDHNHLEVTHSFPLQSTEDHCPINEKGYEAFLAVFSDERFDLSCRVFPTNCSGKFKTELMEQKYDSKSLGEPKSTDLLSSGYGFIEMPREARFRLLGLKGAVPSRLNTSFIYTVKDMQSQFSTDIATGAKSSVYPPKFTHWGSGVFGNGYDFVLMIRNVNHSLNSQEVKGLLKFYGLNKNLEKEVVLGGQASMSVVLSDLLKNEVSEYANEEKIFSWFLKLDKPDAEAFWVSSRKSDGCIVGEHAF